MALRRHHYPETDARPWLDRPDALQSIEQRRVAGTLDDERAALLRNWVRDGYLILEGVVDAATCEAINADVARVHEEFKGLPIEQLKLKFQDMWPRSPATVRAMCHPKLYEWLDLIFDRRALPFQTLNLPVSSQQSAHSDEILMTSHPPGFLIAAWVALEDVQADAGPLAVLPGSHRLPYVSAHEIGIPDGASEAEAGRIFDSRYYQHIEKVVERSGLAPKAFLGKQGDVLLWHSNLLHGAHHIARAGATRKSLIAHYYAEGVELYSDLWQKQNLLPGLR